MNTIHPTLRCSAISLILLAMLVFVGAVTLAPALQTNSAPVMKSPNPEPALPPPEALQASRTAVMSPQEGFKKGVEAVRGHINLLDPNWQVNFRRAESNGWFMTITRFPKPGVTEIKVLIKDNGDVIVLPGL